MPKILIQRALPTAGVGSMSFVGDSEAPAFPPRDVPPELCDGGIAGVFGGLKVGAFGTVGFFSEEDKLLTLGIENI